MIFTRIGFGQWKYFLSHDHDSQNSVRHVNKIHRLIQKRYMYLKLDELFVTWPWLAEIGASCKQTLKSLALSNNFPEHNKQTFNLNIQTNSIFELDMSTVLFLVQFRLCRPKNLQLFQLKKNI